jgi:hypothetical protein
VDSTHSKSIQAKYEIGKDKKMKDEMGAYIASK